MSQASCKELYSLLQIKKIVLVRIQVQVTETLHKLTEAKKERTGSCK